MARTARDRYGRPSRRRARRLDRTRCGERLGSRRGAVARPVINATGVIVHTNLGRAPLAAPAIERVADARRAATATSSTTWRPGRAARARRPRRSAAVPPHRRRSGGRRQQQRGGDAAGAGGARARARGDRVARRAGRDRRRLPRARRDGAVGRDAARGRHDEPDATARLRAGDRRPHRGSSCASTRPTSASRGSPSARRSPSSWRWRTGSSMPVIEDLGSGLAAVGSAPLRHCRRPNRRVRQVLEAGADVVLLQRRQAARRTAGGHHRGPAPLDRSDPSPSADARAARGQAHVRGARGDARRARDGPCGRRRSRCCGWRRSMRTRSDGRAERMAAALRSRGYSAEVVDGMSTVGGGSAPGAGLPTRLLAISRDGLTADALEASLRRLDPPVIARIERDRVVLDLRTVESRRRSANRHAAHSTVGIRSADCGLSSECGPKSECGPNSECGMTECGAVAFCSPACPRSSPAATVQILQDWPRSKPRRRPSL